MARIACFRRPYWPRSGAAAARSPVSRLREILSFYHYQMINHSTVQPKEKTYLCQNRRTYVEPRGRAVVEVEAEGRDKSYGIYCIQRNKYV